MLFRKTSAELSGCDQFCLIIILLVGFGLRLHQLGNDSLWNDEAGVVLAALAPSIQDTIRIAKSHAMAMPLDYLVIRLVSKVGLHEFILRLPSAIFGTLTLAACYNLFQFIAKKPVALLAVLMLSLSPLHIMYSQEVRFYSSLLFFYYCSTSLLLKAVLNPKRITKWALFALFCVIGAYFHIFVLLSVVNGFIWILFRFRKQTLKDMTSCFLVSTLAICLAVLPGYLYFGSQQKFNYPLLLWSDSLLKEIALGLGWCELPFVMRPNLGSVWYLLCMGLSLVGLVIVVRTFSIGLITLLVSSVLQTFLVISADIAKGYWFVYRQLLFLHPVGLLFSSLTLYSGLKVMQRTKIKDIMAIAIICLLILASHFFSLQLFPLAQKRGPSD